MSVRPGFSQTAFVVFKRVVAVYLVVLALVSWAGLIGLSMDGAGRFDVVNANVRFVELALAVLYPVAATGLWFGVGWGLVLWAIGAAVEMFLVGAAAALVGIHVLLFGLYAAFWIYLAFIRRR